MVDIRRLDGTRVETGKLGRNERIAAFLAELVEENDAGRLAAIVTVFMTPECAHRVDWALPDQDFGYPWGLALRGALVAAQHAIGNATFTVHAPEPTEG